MRTEDQLAKELRHGQIQVKEALDELRTSDDLYVYDTIELDDEARWDDVEAANSGSSDLYTSLRAAGATEEQLDEAAAGVARIRGAGRTIESTFT